MQEPTDSTDNSSHSGSYASISKSLTIIKPNEQIKKAELLINTKAQSVFNEFCDLVAVDYPANNPFLELLNAEHIRSLPGKSKQIFNIIHSIVKKNYLHQLYTSGMYPVPKELEHVYYIPRKMQKDLEVFSQELIESHGVYFTIYTPERRIALLEPWYQALLDTKNIQKFSEQYNDEDEETELYKAVALKKIAKYKFLAYKENRVEINPKTLSKARKKLFNMCKYFDDADVRKESLNALKDLIESDPLTADNPGDILLLHSEMEQFVKENKEIIQGKLKHNFMETYAKNLLLILLYSPKKGQNSIVLEEDTRLASKQFLKDLDKYNTSKDQEFGYWNMFAQHALDLMNTTKSSHERRLDVASAFVTSTAMIAAAAGQHSLGTVVSELEQSYMRIQKAIHDNVLTIPVWFPAVVLVNRYCQKTLTDPEAFHENIPSIRKYKHVKTNEVKFGIIATLERVIMKTPYKEIEFEALKLLLQYLNIHDDQIAYSLVKALGHILKQQHKQELSKVIYVLIKLIDAIDAVNGKDNKLKVKIKLEKYKHLHPAVHYNAHHPFNREIINYFLKEHVGAHRTDFVVHSSFQSNCLKLIESHPKPELLLKKMDEVLKITDLDLYRRNLLHTTVLNRIHEMITIIRKSRLKIDINAQEFQEGNTALHIAAKLSYPEAIESLLDEMVDPVDSSKRIKRANANIKNKEGNTPLHFAATTTVHIIRLLLQNNADPCPVNKAGQTPLAIAIEQDRYYNAAEFMKKLKIDNKQFDINVALTHAIEMQKRSIEPYETLKMLLLYVKEIDHVIAHKIITMMVSSKKERKCSDDFARFHINQLEINEKYRTSFERFKDYPQPCLDKAGQLIVAGEWPKAQQPLMQMMQANEVRQLREYNFNTDDIDKILNSTDKSGKSALSYAAFYPNMEEFIPILIRKGATIEHFDHLGFAPLHIAVIKGNVPAARQLLNYRANINIQTNIMGQFTPLQIASYMLNTEMVDLLLRSGASTIQSQYGYTPAHMALLYSVNKVPQVPDIDLSHTFKASPLSSPVIGSNTINELGKKILLHPLYQEIEVFTIADEMAIRDRASFQQLEKQYRCIYSILDTLSKMKPASQRRWLNELNLDLFTDLEYLKKIDDTYKLVHKILSLRDALLSLETDEAKKADLKTILSGLTDISEVSVAVMTPVEQKLRLIYIIIKLYKYDPAAFNKKDSFGNNMLHLSAQNCCPWVSKVICYYEPDLFWKENYDQLWPIEFVQNDTDRVFAIFNAKNIDYAVLDWDEVNQITEKNEYIKELAKKFDEQRKGRLPLGHLLAKANLSALYERLILLDHKAAVAADKTLFLLSSLHVAAQFGHLKILEICFNFQKKFNIPFLTLKDYYNNTPGHVAIINGQLEFAKQYITLDKKLLKAKNNDGRTMLHLAAIYGYKEMVEYIITITEADDTDKTVFALEPDAYRNIPLHFACIYRHPEIVTYLVDKYPKSVITKGEEGRSALHFACMVNCNTLEHKGRLSIGDCNSNQNDTLLIIKTLRKVRFDLDIRDSALVTPFMMACANGNVEVVSLLLGKDIQHKRLADIRAKDITLRTPLHHATNGGYEEVIKLLFDHDREFPQEGAEPLYSMTDINKETPLLMLAKRLRRKNKNESVLVEILRTFIKMGSNLTERDENETGLLHLVSQNGNEILASFLLNRSARTVRNLLRISKNGNTPLHAAALAGHLDLVTLLVSAGNAVSSQNTEGKTALMYAAMQNNLSVLLFLMRRSYDLSLIDSDGCNFMHYFLLEKNALNDEEKQFLIEAIQRQPKIISKREIKQGGEGDTPFHLVARNGNLDALKIIFKYYPPEKLSYLKNKKNRYGKNAYQVFDERNSKLMNLDNYNGGEIEQNFKEFWLTYPTEAEHGFLNTFAFRRSRTNDSITSDSSISFGLRGTPEIRTTTSAFFQNQIMPANSLNTEKDDDEQLVI